MGRALYDFTGKTELRQLTFRKDEMIKITNQYQNGWWAGELNGQIGYLPSTYVQIEGPAPASSGGPKPGPPPPARTAGGGPPVPPARGGAMNGAPRTLSLFY